MKFFPLIFAFAFFSCTDVSPSVSAVKSVAVFDYGGEKCESRLAVFVEVKSDVHLAKKLTVKCEPEGYEWTVENPVKFQQDENQSFAGYANLVAPEGKKIPRGKYTAIYEDLSSREIQADFFVDYPEEIYDAGNSAEKIQSESAAKKTKGIAIYSAEKTLLYFGSEKKEWSDRAKIRDDYKNAFCYKECFYEEKTNVLCLMAEQKIL